MTAPTWIRYAPAMLLIASSSCTSDDQNTGLGSSQRGESCQKTADCAAGLVCTEGVCRLGDLNIVPNGNQCVLIDCETNDDCCLNFTAATNCTSYQTSCSTSGDPASYACTYSTGPSCVCDKQCTENRCVSPITETSCTTDSNCSSTDRFCNSGTCGPCATDTQCQTRHDPAYRCVEGACMVGCTIDDNCDAFHQCVSNLCTLVGCSSDRECISASTPDAVCDPTATPVPTCVTRCKRDSECLTDGGESSASGVSALKVCGSNGICQDAGCETDAECRVRLLPDGNPESVPGQRAVCRPKTP